MKTRSPHGQRIIDGRYYMLAGRDSDAEEAREHAKRLRTEWERVRVVKLWEYDYMLYVHARKEGK